MAKAARIGRMASTSWPSGRWMEPGVPAEALRHGYHWLANQNDGAVIVRQWSPDDRSWLVNSARDRLCPKEMDHMRESFRLQAV
jgi:hypothetical protein